MREVSHTTDGTFLIMETNHQEIIQLIIAYTLVGAFVFTVIITCLSIVGWIQFANHKQQNKLFTVLIVEIVVIGVSFFGNFLNYNPKQVSENIETQAIVSTHERIYSLLDRVESISDIRAISLVANPPGITPELSSLVDARDPSGLRSSDPEVARDLIKMQLVMGRRTPSILDSWSQALDGQ